VSRARRPSLFAAAVVAAGLSLAGCGGTDTGAGTAAPAGPTFPSATGSAAATPTSAAPSTGTKPGVKGGPIAQPDRSGLLPAGFPVPPGTRIGPIRVTSDGGVAATMTVTEGKTAQAFWTSRLPAAGYAVSRAEMVGGIGEITFGGRSCGAGSQLGISDRDVTLECRHG
jgi:hypothetical protein